MSNKPKSTTAAQLKPRNPLSLNPLMKKSHAHSKSAKAQRTKDKQALKKELNRNGLGDHD